MIESPVLRNIGEARVWILTQTGFQGPPPASMNHYPLVLVYCAGTNELTHIPYSKFQSARYQTGIASSDSEAD